MQWTNANVRQLVGKCHWHHIRRYCKCTHGFENPMQFSKCFWSNSCDCRMGTAGQTKRCDHLVYNWIEWRGIVSIGQKSCFTQRNLWAKSENGIGQAIQSRIWKHPIEHALHDQSIGHNPEQEIGHHCECIMPYATINATDFTDILG